MPFNPGNKRLQRARHGAAPSSAGGVSRLPDGKGGFVTVTNGSVLNFGGNMKFGLFPTVGVPLSMLLKLDDCCRPGMLAPCFNTVQPPASCSN